MSEEFDAEIQRRGELPLPLGPVSWSVTVDETAVGEHQRNVGYSWYAGTRCACGHLRSHRTPSNSYNMQKSSTGSPPARPGMKHGGRNENGGPSKCKKTKRVPRHTFFSSSNYADHVSVWLTEWHALIYTDNKFHIDNSQFFDVTHTKPTSRDSAARPRSARRTGPSKVSPSLSSNFTQLLVINNDVFVMMAWRQKVFWHTIVSYYSHLLLFIKKKKGRRRIVQ